MGVTVNRSSYSQRGEDADYERYTVSPPVDLVLRFARGVFHPFEINDGECDSFLGELSVIDQVIDSLQIQLG